jgi:formylglycine-generating enzyme required for sulfatase activity
MCHKIRSLTLLWLITIQLGILGCINKLPENMALIPAGPFIMGTDEMDTEQKAAQFGIIKPWFEDEHPAHQVHLPAYYIDRYELTNAQYQEFVRATGYRPPPYWNGLQYPAGTDSYPVVMVSWEDAQSYCKWAGKRLPTEGEWEKAARPDQRLYPWGNDFDANKANIGGTRGGLTPVGSYEAGQSPFGVYDLVGNVWEWTEDWYKPYPGNTFQDKNFGEKNKVLRGGSWSTVGHYPPEITRQIVAHNARTTFRLHSDPKILLNDIGLRCAKSK